ncbi:MAG: neutral/alkaline non-lysosomal ceramidase N-terminal domain-containing protein [Armatimonadota bacterium]
MKIGFGKVDITPRVGVELCGFGPYMNRHSIAVRDRLWSRAMAIQQGETTLVLVSNDLICFGPDITEHVRELVNQATGIPHEAIMVHCTHTHSGPSVDRKLFGWGDLDEPYMALLPRRVADACIAAYGNLAEATLSHAAVPCEGIGLNREYDRDAPPLEDVLQDDWRPAKPELTDTTCHVLKVESGGRMIGFASYFGCHPVVCCEETRYIHGDYAGVATNLLEREYPRAIGLFLQGAQGDVNSCVVHKPEQASLLALDIIAGRYAHAVRAGLAQATPLQVDALAYTILRKTFPRIKLNLDELRAWLAEKESVVNAPEATDTDREMRMSIVYVLTLRRLIAALEHGEIVEEPTELQGFRIGPLALLGTPFEIFQAIKNEAVTNATAPIPLVLGLTNDSLGYAPDRTAAARGGYAAQMVPIMKGSLPFDDIHGQLVQALAELDQALTAADQVSPA